MIAADPVPAKPAIRLTEAARRRVAMLRWAFIGIAIWALALALVEHSMNLPPSARIFVNTLWWSLGAFLAAAFLVDRFIHAPTTEGAMWVVFSTASTFTILLILFGATHAAYSRMAMLIGVVLATAWLLLGARLHVRGYVLRLGVCEPAVMERLAEAEKALSSVATRMRTQLIATTDIGELRKVDGAVIDRYSTKDDAMQRLITLLKLDGVRIYSADYVHELLTGRISLEHTEDSFLDDSSGHIVYAFIKRVLDMIGAALILVAIGIPMVLVGLAIRAETSGAALFRQQRVGRNGHPFQMYKFRTMRSVPAGQFGETAADSSHLTHDDSRITALGRVLRKYRIDELPQLINVLNGTMSLIGPRPEWTETARDFFARIPHYPYRHLVRPGITGWAQVHQGHVVDFYDAVIKLELDLYYVKHLSFALDLVIALRTVRTILTGAGAR